MTIYFNIGANAENPTVAKVRAIRQNTPIGATFMIAMVISIITSLNWLKKFATTEPLVPSFASMIPTNRVPGVYWSYCYALVPYLLAENPYMTATRAMELSKEMMEGEKWNYFVLQLSFFGWLLLCAFTLGIGGFFLEPYMQATYAEFYAAMRSKALATGMSTTDELGGFVRHDTF